MTLYDQIKTLLTPEAVAKLKPEGRVDLVRLVSGAVFGEHDYETHEIIGEAMEPYRENHCGEDDDDEEDDSEDEDRRTLMA